MTDQFLQVTPFMHVADVDATVAFFTDLLGFDVPFRMPGYAYVEREGCGVRILEAGEGNPLLPGNRRFRYYFDVRDVDALYADLKPKPTPCHPATCTGPPTSRTDNASCWCSRPTATGVLRPRAVRCAHPVTSPMTWTLPMDQHYDETHEAVREITRRARPGQRQRTRKDLLQAAARLLKDGRRPSLDEVAEAANVSRATAYRYFPGMEALLLEASLEVSVPEADVVLAGAGDDPIERLEKIDDALTEMILANEHTRARSWCTRCSVRPTVRKAHCAGSPDAADRSGARAGAQSVRERGLRRPRGVPRTGDRRRADAGVQGRAAGR